MTMCAVSARHVQYRWTQYPADTAALLRCASPVNDTVRDGETFGRRLHDIGGHISAGNSNSSRACVSVDLMLASFFAKVSAWECRHGLVLDATTWRCQIGTKQ